GVRALRRCARAIAPGRRDSAGRRAAAGRRPAGRPEWPAHACRSWLPSRKLPLPVRRKIFTGTGSALPCEIGVPLLIENPSAEIARLRFARPAAFEAGQTVAVGLSQAGSRAQIDAPHKAGGPRAKVIQRLVTEAIRRPRFIAPSMHGQQMVTGGLAL